MLSGLCAKKMIIKLVLFSRKLDFWLGSLGRAAEAELGKRNISAAEERKLVFYDFHVLILRYLDSRRFVRPLSNSPASKLPWQFFEYSSRELTCIVKGVLHSSARVQ